MRKIQKYLKKILVYILTLILILITIFFSINKEYLIDTIIFNINKNNTIKIYYEKYEEKDKYNSINNIYIKYKNINLINIKYLKYNRNYILLSNIKSELKKELPQTIKASKTIKIDIWNKKLILEQNECIVNIQKNIKNLNIKCEKEQEKINKLIRLLIK